MYLLVIEYFSRYIEIAKLFNTSSQSVINHLKSIFARHGIHECFMSDGGPPSMFLLFLNNSHNRMGFNILLLVRGIRNQMDWPSEVFKQSK